VNEIMKTGKGQLFCSDRNCYYLTAIASHSCTVTILIIKFEQQNRLLTDDCWGNAE